MSKPAFPEFHAKFSDNRRATEFLPLHPSLLAILTVTNKPLDALRIMNEARKFLSRAQQPPKTRAMINLKALEGYADQGLLLQTIDTGGRSFSPTELGLATCEAESRRLRYMLKLFEAAGSKS